MRFRNPHFIPISETYFRYSIPHSDSAFYLNQNELTNLVPEYI